MGNIPNEADKDAGHIKCLRCSAPCDDGEGWNGFCGNCADVISDADPPEVCAWCDNMAHPDLGWCGVCRPEAGKLVVHQVVFIREATFPDLVPEIIWVVELHCRPELATLQDALQALENGLTEWAHTMDSGKQAWRESAQDFNIGDLMNIPEQFYLHILARHGIERVELVWEMKPQAVVSFDRVLVREWVEEGEEE